MTNQLITQIIDLIDAPSHPIASLDRSRYATPDDFYRRDRTDENAEYDRQYAIAKPIFDALPDDALRALILDLFDCKTMRQFNRKFDNSDDYEYATSNIPEPHHNAPIFNALIHAAAPRIIPE